MFCKNTDLQHIDNLICYLIYIHDCEVIKQKIKKIYKEVADMYILILSVFANITIIAKNLLDMFIVIKETKK